MVVVVRSREATGGPRARGPGAGAGQGGQGRAGPGSPGGPAAKVACLTGPAAFWQEMNSSQMSSGNLRGRENGANPPPVQPAACQAAGGAGAAAAGGREARRAGGRARGREPLTHEPAPAPADRQAAARASPPRAPAPPKQQAPAAGARPRSAPPGPGVGRPASVFPVPPVAPGCI